MIDPRIEQSIDLLKGVINDNQANFAQALQDIKDPDMRKFMVEKMKAAKAGNLNTQDFQRDLQKQMQKK